MIIVLSDKSILWFYVVELDHRRTSRWHFTRMNIKRTRLTTRTTEQHQCHLITLAANQSFIWTDEDDIMYTVYLDSVDNVYDLNLPDCLWSFFLWCFVIFSLRLVRRLFWGQQILLAHALTELTMFPTSRNTIRAINPINMRPPTDIKTYNMKLRELQTEISKAKNDEIPWTS